MGLGFDFDLMDTDIGAHECQGLQLSILVFDWAPTVFAVLSIAKMYIDNVAQIAEVGVAASSHDYL